MVGCCRIVPHECVIEKGLNVVVDPCLRSKILMHNAVNNGEYHPSLELDSICPNLEYLVISTCHCELEHNCPGKEDDVMLIETQLVQEFLDGDQLSSSLPSRPFMIVCRQTNWTIRRWMKKKRRAQCICHSIASNGGECSDTHQLLLLFQQRQEFLAQCWEYFLQHHHNEPAKTDLIIDQLQSSPVVDVCAGHYNLITKTVPSTKCCSLKKVMADHRCTESNRVFLLSKSLRNQLSAYLIAQNQEELAEQVNQRYFAFACSHLISVSSKNINNNMDTVTTRTKESVREIDGLTYIPNFLSDEEQIKLVNLIDSNPFSTVIHRRQQYYGEVYYHTSKDVSEIQPSEEEQHIGALPLQDMQWLIDKLIAETSVFQADHPPTQCLVNEYIGSQGIKSHFDDSNAFGPIIASISLVDPIFFTLKLPAKPTNECNDILACRKYFLEPGSLFVMEREARYDWRHSITKAKSMEHPITKALIHRDQTYRRLSITIRHVLDGRKRTDRNNS